MRILILILGFKGLRVYPDNKVQSIFVGERWILFCVDIYVLETHIDINLRENLAAIYLSRLHSDYTTKIDTKVLKQTQHFEIKYRIDSQLIKLFVFYVDH